MDEHGIKFELTVCTQKLLFEIQRDKSPLPKSHFLNEFGTTSLYFKSTTHAK